VDPHRPLYTSPAIPENEYADGIECSRTVKDGLAILQYKLGECGTVTHIISNTVTNAREIDANYLLENYQKASLPFRRYTLHTRAFQFTIDILRPDFLTII
jgi:hypothetical protein